MDRNRDYAPRRSAAHLHLQGGRRGSHGTITTPRGDTDITDGKVDGDNISFTQKLSFNGNDITINYSGKVDGDSIKFTRQMGDRPAVSSRLLAPRKASRAGSSSAPFERGGQSQRTAALVQR